MATWELEIVDAVASLGHEPTESLDDIGIFDGYALSDAVTFEFAVPTGYTSGTELELKLHEATDEVGSAHKWQAVVTMGTGNPVTKSSQVISNEADAKTYRTLTLSTSGKLDNVALATGNRIVVVLSRIAASANEDASDIRLYGIFVSFTIADSTLSNCGGRTGKIIDTVLDLYRDGTNQDFLTAVRVLRYMNEVLDEIVQDHHFIEEDTIDVVANQTQYRLGSLFPDIVAPLDIWWTDSKIPLVRRNQRSTINELRETISGISDNADWYSLCWFQDGLDIEVAPVPTTAWAAGWTLRRSRHPGEIGCEVNFDPPTPPVFDSLYVNGAMRRAFQLDRGGRRALELLRLYHEMYQHDRLKLLRNTRNAIRITR